MISSAPPTNPRPRSSARWLLTSAVLLASPACSADELHSLPLDPSLEFRGTVNHTTFQAGDVPILLTVPHDGNETPAGVPERTTPYSGLVKSRELHLRDIAVDVADRLENTHGITPYLVIGESHRRYIDYNRDELESLGGGANEAYETAAADPFYDEYHSRIDGYITDIQGTYDSGLLIDLHGTSSVPDKIVRGTRNGDAIWELLEGHEVTAITASEEPYPGETAAMAQDGDLNTRWRSWGTNEWIEFDLGSNKTIASVEIAITLGDVRTYDFEIEVWDGASWVIVFNGTNTQATNDFEIYEFAPVVGSKVRLSCHGSIGANGSKANYVKEIRIQEHGWDPIVGPGSVFGELADAGYTLEPLNSEYGTGAETTFIGGFTVDHHGSENGGLDAFQMEIGMDYRDTQAERDQLVIDLAAAIASYHATY
ncbi:MAG: discoidin domain-containing protein [Myxococcota bacterium]